MMKGRTLLVVLVALLAVAAMPASAQNASAVASMHTTFGTGSAGEPSPTTLQDMSIQGSGESASVVYSGGGFSDGFEDGDIAEYGGETADFDVSTTAAHNGSHSLVKDASSGQSLITEPNSQSAQGDTLRYYYYGEGSGSNDAGIAFGLQGDGGYSSNSGYIVKLDAGDTTTQLGRLDSGSSTRLEEDASTAIPTGEWLEITVDWASDGTITVTVEDSSGQQVTQISHQDTNYASGHVGVWAFYSGGYVDDVDVNPGIGPSGQYVGATHDAEAVETGFVNLSVSDAEAAVAWQADPDDDGTFTNVTTATYSSGGNYTADLSGVDDDEWRVRVDAAQTSSSGGVEIHDEGVLFEAADPSLSNADPTGAISQQNITLSIDVADTDFGLVQNDSVTAEFFVDGGSVGNDTLGSNGTASVTYSTTSGGNHSWHVVATDSYGNSTTSSTFEFQSPSTLYLRQEDNPGQLVDSATVQITAYYSGNVQRRNVTNGKMNLTGFPLDEPIILRANASGHYTRTAVVESVFEQDSMYLLNDSTDAYLVRYNLQDLTGDYPRSDTVLFVDRDITLNNSTEWRTIAGDNFGVQGVPVNLEQDERYRIRIKNLDTGETAVIGAYTAIQNETVTLSTGSATIDLPESEQEYSFAASENETAQQITVRYEDQANQTESIKVTIHERFNNSNVLVDNASFSTNDLTYQQSLTANQTNTTWVAELYVDRGDGYMHFRVPLSGGTRALLPAGLDSVWVQAIGVFVLLISAMAFSELNQGVGAITTSLVGGVLWWFGIYGSGTAGVLVVVSLAVSVAYHYYTPAGGGDI